MQKLSKLPGQVSCSDYLKYTSCETSQLKLLFDYILLLMMALWGE